MNRVFRISVIITGILVISGCINSSRYTGQSAHPLILDKPISRKIAVKIICEENEYLPPKAIEKVATNIASRERKLALVRDDDPRSVVMTIQVGGIGKLSFREAHPDLPGVNANASVITLDAVVTVDVDGVSASRIIRGLSSEGALLIKPVEEQRGVIQELALSATEDLYNQAFMWVAGMPTISD